MPEIVKRSKEDGIENPDEALPKKEILIVSTEMLNGFFLFLL